MLTQVQPSAFDREGIMQALREDPIARLTCRDIPDRLRRGDEYLDLQRLDVGVQRAQGTMIPTGGELARTAVRADTWARLLVYLVPRALGAR